MSNISTSEVSDSLEMTQHRLRKFAQDRDWEQFHDAKNLSMALIAEAAELVEHFQWLTPQQSMNLSAEKKDLVALELADIQIYLLRTADRLGIDVLDAVWRKIEINEARFPIEKVRGDARRASEYQED